MVVSRASAKPPTAPTRSLTQKTVRSYRALCRRTCISARHCFAARQTLIKGGTTCALTMETVNHTAEVFRVVEETGFRATVGKCMMDKGEGVPSLLHENTEDSIRESLDLLEAWHGREDGRIRYCFAPRFAVSCTSDLLRQVARLACERGVMVHSHASENETECDLVERDTGMRNVTYLDSLGLTGEHVALAHCIHVDTAELETLKRTHTNVVHCPSSNLKLGSGIAPITRTALTARLATIASTCSPKCARPHYCKKSCAAPKHFRLGWFCAWPRSRAPARWDLVTNWEVLKPANEPT